MSYFYLWYSYTIFEHTRIVEFDKNANSVYTGVFAHYAYN